MKIKFGGADTRSIKMLNSFPHGLFISEFVNNRDEKIHRFLCKNYLENGAALFGRESSDEMNDFRKVVGGALDNVSDEDVSGIIQFYVQRLRNYGHIESFFQARIRQARIVCADIPRTDTCKFYEGKLISVEDAFNKLKWLQTLTPEEYGREISNNVFDIPPFYQFCRCRLEGIVPGVVDNYEKQKPKIKAETVWDLLADIDKKNSGQDVAQMPQSEFEELLNQMLEASDMLPNNPYPRANLERQVGEILLAKGHDREAIKHLDKAMSINPKVGVKKLLYKLKEK